MKLRYTPALASGLAAFLAAPLAVHAQFTFITNNGAIPRNREYPQGIGANLLVVSQ